MSGLFIKYSMDKDKTLKINWNEWREYHLLNPSGHSIHDIIQFWRHAIVSRLVCAMSFTCVLQWNSSVMILHLMMFLV